MEHVLSQCRTKESTAGSEVVVACLAAIAGGGATKLEQVLSVRYLGNLNRYSQGRQKGNSMEEKHSNLSMLRGRRATCR